MNLSGLLQIIRNLPQYQQMLVTISKGDGLQLSLDLPRAARPAFAAALTEDLNRPVLFVVARNDRLLNLLEEIPAWAAGLEVHPFPVPSPLFYELAPWDERTIRQRATVLAKLTAQSQPGAPENEKIPHCSLILAPVRAIMMRTLSPRQFIANSRWVKLGGIMQLERFIRLLVNNGYIPSSLVTEPGQFSRRGGILDLWPPAQEQPARIELFGDEVDSIRAFDPTTQRSNQEINYLRLTPAREGLPGFFQEEWLSFLSSSTDLPHDTLLEFFLPSMNPMPAGLIDFLPKDSVILLDDRMSLEDSISEFEQQAIELRDEQIESNLIPQDFLLPYLTINDINEALERYTTIDFGRVGAEHEPDFPFTDHFHPGPRFGGQLRPLMEHIGDRLMQHEIVVVASRQSPRLAELYSQENMPIAEMKFIPAELFPGELFFIQGALSEGWILRSSELGNIHLLTDAEIFGWARPRPRRRPVLRATAPEADYADLKLKDWVVHVDYGVGIFQGLVERTLDNLKREYLLIEYAEGDQVYVPIHQADRVTRYVGADGIQPALSRLGTQEWERAKIKAQQAVEEIAKELLNLYASRSTVIGHPFSADTAWQHELEASFPYAETDDQVRAIEAVKRSMEIPRPMDILICGDAGYGKTEVALRAAFKAVMDSKQVAILVPTTILAQQHYHTFKQRLAAFPVEVEMLSRFRNRQEINKILNGLQKNIIDIVIGTHRLLQSDVRFHDLGLLIIDEEQRFGVTHKEYLKQKRTEVDVLTLTATPIPRTLYMALTGARDILTINTPPEERLPVITHVGPYDPRLVRQAILRELDRGGQIFFVHNRVMTIDTIRKQLERMVPEARIAVAHGQMPENELALVMESFSAGEIDILVSTTIIESGLDFPNANTLVVDRAENFGLAQLYQLRGRVGRGTVRAYAYFFRHPSTKVNEEAFQRLEIFSEHTQLGAGYSLAMRDLELRGAGDILGTRQHGYISAIGFHLYTRLLAAAVRRKKTEYGPQLQMVDQLPQTALPLAVSIDLPLPSTIPAVYVPDRQLRLQLYRRMAELRSPDEIDSLAAELEDRFGEFPAEVTNLLYQLRIRLLAAELNLISITTENGQILIQLPESWPKERIPHLGVDIRVSKRGLWLSRNNVTNWKDRLVEILHSLKTKTPF